MKDILALVGFVAVAWGLILFVILGIEFIKDKIDEAKHVYRYKHRFDKPPIANCYCVDCKNYNVETHRCYGFHEDSNRLVADNYFCYRAEPRKRG